MRIATFLTLLCMGVSPSLQAQVNNPIFNGGAADGAAVAHYVIPTNSAIFTGGSGDGHDKDSYVSPTNSSIFAGGSGDGHDKDSYMTPTNSAIFGGGSGDGHDKDAYVTPTNSGIFAGGIGDGFDAGCNDPYIAPYEDPDLCPEDLNEDGMIDVSDFLIFNSAFGNDCDCRADINGDGTVDITDFLSFNSAFGNDCPTIIGLQANDEGNGFQLSFALQNALRGVDKDDIHPDLMEKIAGPVETIDFSLFPNPNSGREVELYLRREESDFAMMRIEVLDTRGREILDLNSNAIGESQSEIIRFEQPLTRGLYFVHVILDGQRVVKKLVVQ